MPSTKTQQSSAMYEILLASELATGSIVHMVLRAAIELNLLEILERAGPGKQLSALELAAQLPTQNPDAPDMLDRMLSLLASYSILACSQITTEDDQVQRIYGLAPISKHLIPNRDGVSLSPLLLMVHHKSYMDSWYHLKDAVLEGGIPFNRAHGMQIYEYLGMDPSFNEVFNKTMVNLSISAMKEIVEIYNGFEKANVVVDVGGGLGENINLITSKYSKIKGINFDLPHVIAAAPAYNGVEHVAGDMFLGVPKGDIIMLKMILHNWGDEHCVSLLKKCYEALPEDGKVVVVEILLSPVPETDLMTKEAFRLDLLMMAQHIGGKERTEKDYRALAKEAGFSGCRFISRVFTSSVLEFHKTI